MKNSSKTNVKQNKGQALTETLMVFFLTGLFLILSFEVIRILSFKSFLTSITQDVSRQLSYYGLYLEDRELHTVVNINLLESKISRLLKKKSYSVFFHHEENFKFDIKLYIEKNRDGIAVKIMTCLPSLFSFKNEGQSYNCLGHRGSSLLTSTLDWRIRSASFSLWSPDVSLYKDGMKLPEEVRFIQSKGFCPFCNPFTYKSLSLTRRYFND